MRNAGLLGRASILASIIYRQLELNKRGQYRKLVAMSMALLRDEWSEEDVLTGLRTAAGIIEHREWYRYFVAKLDRRREGTFAQQAIAIRDLTFGNYLREGVPMDF